MNETKGIYIPKTVFLSGGTALHKVSSCLGYLRVFASFNKSELEGYWGTGKIDDLIQHSSHIITCFDSGGSSAILREVLLSFPAVGDLRNRLCSIAQGILDAHQFFDQQQQSQQQHTSSFVHLCKYRFPNEKESSLLSLSSADLVTVLSSFSHYLSNSNLEMALKALSQPPLVDLFVSQLLPLIQNLPQEICSLCGQYLETFLSAIFSSSPSCSSFSSCSSFNCYNASLGNLILTGAYLQHHESLVTAVETLSVSLGISSGDPIAEPLLPFIRIIPASTAHLTLGARLQSGDLILGQHAITQEKGATLGLHSPIESIFLIDYPSSPAPLPALLDPPLLSCLERSANASPEAIASLTDADLVCYSVGSFFTSIVASLLPTGLSTAIRKNHRAVKVYLPNMTLDTEMIGLSLYEATDLLIRTMYQHDTIEEEGDNRPLPLIPSNYLTVVLLDRLSLSLSCSSTSSSAAVSTGYPHFGSYQQILASVEALRGEMGVQVREEDLCSFSDEKMNKVEINPIKLLRVLRQLLA
jgi:2-phospho-L-lactate transferase/gluconeogenesis factor (CofD/UPF0052 family)